MDGASRGGPPLRVRPRAPRPPAAARLPLDKFDGQGSRLPGAIIKNPGGGKQKHWATCWVIDRRAKYAAASGEATAAAEYLRDPHKVISTTEHGAFVIHGGRATITRGQKDAGILALESLSAPGATAKQHNAPYEDRAAEGDSSAQDE